MSDYCIGGSTAARSTSSNRLVEDMDQVSAPLFQRIAGAAKAACEGTNGRQL